ncbi:MAG: acyl-ACP--UDP-N-acetylglucosamine O-acyltransferase [Candidatus Puniceispirillales bacterium]
MADLIHPTAIIEDGARIAGDVRIGPYCVIGSKVNLGEGTILHSHVVIDGNTRIGRNNEIHPFAVLGKKPQHTQYKGEDSVLEIGDGNTIRENVTMHPGTAIDNMITKVGDNNLFFVGCHIAHDCVLGDNIIVTNDAMLGGHVHIGDYAYIGGNSAIKQYVRIGGHAMISGMTGVTADVIPFGSVFGPRAVMTGLNLVGMKRRGFSRDQITTLRRAYRLLFANEGTFSERLDEVSNLYGHEEEVAKILKFITDGGDKPLCHPDRDSG